MSSTPNRPSGLSKTPLSSSLRERLKRCGRYHSASPSGGLPQGAAQHSTQTASHDSSAPGFGSSSSPGLVVLSPRQLQDPSTPARGGQAKPCELQSPSPLDSSMFKSPAGLTTGRGCSQEENFPLVSSDRQCPAASTPVLARPRRESFKGKRLSLSLTPHSNTGSHVGTLLSQQTDSSEGGDGQENASTNRETKLSENDMPVSVLEECTPPECKLPRLSLSQPDSTPPQSSHTHRTPASVPASPALSPSEAGTEVSSFPLCDSQSPSRTQTEEDVRSQIRSVQSELSQQSEILRKLRLVKMYRSKNNLAELQSLIDKWRQASQQALQDLHASLPDPRPPLAILLQHLSIPLQLVAYDPDSDTFT